MDTKQPALLGTTDASEKSATPLHIGIIADTPNAMIEAPFESQVRRALRNDENSRHTTLTARPLLNRLHTKEGESELRHELSQDVQVVVAMLGVPHAMNYEQDVHQLLTAWSGAKKPVLLIASNDPRITQKAVDSWQGWELLAKRMHQPVSELKKAVIVNDEYLVAQSGEKALAQIKNSATVAEALKPILSPAEAPRPTISVQKPQMVGQPGLELTLKA